MFSEVFFKMETGNPASMTDRILSLILFIIHVVEAYLEAIYRFFIPVNQRSLTGEIILVSEMRHIHVH